MQTFVLFKYFVSACVPVGVGPRLEQHTQDEVGYIRDGVIVVLSCLNGHKTFHK